jgi:hypothetical protein
MKTENGSNRHGYHTFTLGAFGFERDEYFAHVWPKGRHLMQIDACVHSSATSPGGSSTALSTSMA